MTLIEVLIATALTLMIMLALAQGFKTTSQSISSGRARLTSSDQLRSISTLLRSDLQGLTVSTTVHPQSSKSPNGYFVYYDGPLSDSTAMLFNYVPTGTEIEDKLSASRWSDIDDVMMFTAKARDGQWFYGRVPLALMKIHSGDISTINFQDWLTDVTIASEYAEIAWFMRPLNEVGMLNNPDPQNSDGSYSSSPSSTPVNDVIPVVDLNGDGIPDPDGMPDRVALCRRVMLIRPDLDVSISRLSAVPDDEQLIAAPMPVDLNDADSFRYQMRFAYQRTDLSVRKHWDAANSRFVLKTNSLGDLQRPENRFAHYCLPFSARGYGMHASLPILALTSENSSMPRDLNGTRINPNGTIADESNGNYSSMIDSVVNGYSAIFSVLNDFAPLDRGFVPSAFCRTNLVSTGNSTYAVQHTQEEMVASNVVGFDVRGYDSTAIQLYAPGVDGLYGSLTDRDAPIAQKLAAAGERGYDDLIVGPSDPGYAVMLKFFEDEQNGVIIPASTGAFVDLSWGFRVVNQLTNASGQTYGLVPSGSIWYSSLSGFDPKTRFVFNNRSVIDSMIRSGKFVRNIYYQPTFDTFTDFYESDGDLQYVDQQAFMRAINLNGLVPYGWPRLTNLPSPDRGIDGIDNPGIFNFDDDGDMNIDNDSEKNGVIDEEAEQDTSPPYRYAIPAIQIKLRVQDATAGTLQELSMVHSLQGN
jgi:hypothetical protein